MRVLTRALATLGLAAIAGATSLSAQSAGVGANRFYVGASAGGMDFGTDAQTRGTIPMVGAQALITANRAALLLAADFGLGSGETATMWADSVDNTTRQVTFDNINRFYFMLMAYPLKSHVQPFVGIGWGIQTLSNIQVQGSFVDGAAAAASRQKAENLGSYGFFQGVGGVEIRVGILNLFGSVSIATGGNPEDLVGSVYTAQGGVRFSLGKAKEDVE
jgi:hypothetical protein